MFEKWRNGITCHIGSRGLAPQRFAIVLAALCPAYHDSMRQRYTVFAWHHSHTSTEASTPCSISEPNAVNTLSNTSRAVKKGMSKKRQQDSNSSQDVAPPQCPRCPPVSSVHHANLTKAALSFTAHDEGQNAAVIRPMLLAPNGCTCHNRHLEGRSKTIVPFGTRNDLAACI